MSRFETVVSYLIVAVLAIFAGVVLGTKVAPANSSLAEYRAAERAKVEQAEQNRIYGYDIDEIVPLRVRDGSQAVIFAIERDGGIILRGKRIATDKELARIITWGDAEEQSKVVPSAPRK